MVGRKTKFTTQNKATQGRRRGETEERGKKKKALQDTGEEMRLGRGGGEDGEETNSKEKQDGGEPGRGKVDFPFFFLF